MSLRINHQAASALRNLNATNDETSGVARSGAGTRAAATTAVPSGAEASPATRTRPRGLGVAHENLAAAGSAVRDADLASAMATKTKLQMLGSADTAKAAQANLTPESVLQLLMG